MAELHVAGRPVLVCPLRSTSPSVPVVGGDCSACRAPVWVSVAMRPAVEAAEVAPVCTTCTARTAAAGVRLRVVEHPAQPMTDDRWAATAARVIAALGGGR